MAPNRVVTLHRWQVAGVFVAFVIVATGVSFWNGYRINQAEDRIERNTELAIAAKVKAARAEDFVENFKSRIKSEKVCTETNRGDPCRALFQRLVEDVSDAQRRQLACAVAQELQLKPQYEMFCG